MKCVVVVFFSITCEHTRLIHGNKENPFKIELSERASVDHTCAGQVFLVELGEVEPPQVGRGSALRVETQGGPLSQPGGQPGQVAVTPQCVGVETAGRDTRQGRRGRRHRGGATQEGETMVGRGTIGTRPREETYTEREDTWRRGVRQRGEETQGRRDPQRLDLEDRMRSSCTGHVCRILL